MKAAAVPGSLAARPAGATAVRANLSFRFHAEQDYALYHDHRGLGRAPVLLDWRQCFAFFEAVVRAARAAVPDLEMILIRANGPHGDWKIPPLLLEESVLLCVDPAFQARKLERSRDFDRFLVVDHGIKRLPLEKGDNRLRLELWGPDANEAAEQLAALRGRLTEYEIDWD